MSRLSSNVEESWAKTGGPMFPTTSEIGFVKAEQRRVVEAFTDWRASLGQNPLSRPLGGGLHEGLVALLPLTTTDRRRWVFFNIGAWTAFFDNGARGTDASPVASFLARTLGCRGLRVVTVPDDGGSYGATILEIYGPIATEFLNYVRTISATNEGGRWRFDLNGEPQAFEDESAYRRRRIKDRFTTKMLADYLRALDVIDAFEPGNYGAPILVERMDPESKAVLKLTLEEARARFTA